ncbi:hypothetical protein KX816_01545 [Sphingosinicellaceae bacterium]|nr:hypothetical protein KX816_01545 [Sphingosinicellaceae bacterium]
MQDEPTPPEILAAVAAFLRESVIPQATPLVAFQSRVAANAVDLVARQLARAPADEAEEAVRLRNLLGRDGDLGDLNAAFAAAIAAGEIDPTTEDAAQHLWKTTLAKVAVDQPKYSGYRAALADDKDA